MWHAEKATENNLLFEMLSKSARTAIFNSMELQTFQAGSSIITQGDEGTKFYVLKEGACDVSVIKEGWGADPRKVLTYAPGRYASSTG